MSAGDGPHCADPRCPFTAAQWAAVRAWLGMPDDVSDQAVGNALSAALDAARVVRDEAEYLSTAVRVGWVGWRLDDLPPDPAD